MRAILRQMTLDLRSWTFACAFFIIGSRKAFGVLPWNRLCLGKVSIVNGNYWKVIAKME
jgi:hypothetical protein